MDIHKQKTRKKARTIRLRFSPQEGVILDKLQARLPLEGRLTRQQVLRAVVSATVDSGLIQATEVQNKADHAGGQKFSVHVEATGNARVYEIIQEIAQIGVSVKWAKRIEQEPCDIEDLTKAQASRLCRALQTEGIRAEIQISDENRKRP